MRRALNRYFRTDRAVYITATTHNRWHSLGYLVSCGQLPIEPETIYAGHKPDLLDDLIEVLPDLLDRQVLFLILQDHTNKEIAVLLSIHLQEVRRIRARLKTLLAEVMDA